MKITKLIFLLAYSFSFYAQNVGINNDKPAYSLDVTGDINLTGNVLANENAGTANQVLMKNSGNFLIWGDIEEFRNYRVFNFTSKNAIQSFNIPSGITKIKVQAWGGGGKGFQVLNVSPGAGAGGGGGGYLEGTLNVNPAQVLNIIVGAGANISDNVASNSIIELPSVYTLTAFAGGTTSGSNNSAIAGGGGNYSFTGTLTTIIGVKGETGKPSKFSYEQISATTFGRSSTYGDGGNSGNTSYTGGKGRYFYQDITTPALLTTISMGIGAQGAVPGGGGAAESSTTNISDGGNGRIIIYW